MDNLSVAKAILESYEEITITKELQHGDYMISLKGKEFLFFIPDENNPASCASIFLRNDDGLDCPHIMLYDHEVAEALDIPDGKYRWVCLYEHESVVNSLSSFEEKIIDAVDRLIELLSMDKNQQEGEFQKEFMFYWNGSAASENEYNVYLSNDASFLTLDAFFHGKTARLIEKGLALNDIDRRENDKRKWVHHIESDVFYIPISDCRGVLPPHKGFNWTSEQVCDIVYGKQVSHISDDTFRLLSSTISTTQSVILVFGMKKFHACFAVRLRFKNSAGRRTLLDKLLNNIEKVETLYTQRKDYRFLCDQIGNDIGLINKKILLIGAGSLGSYVAFELAKNGASKIKIYDADRLEDANILRWAYAGLGNGLNKAEHISLLLGILHPEIQVDAINKNMDEETLEKEAQEYDMIVVTVGSSDAQLKFNRVLKRTSCSIPVIYVWLEAGGTASHILIVNYQKPGCFECLYTDEDGTPVNNRANNYKRSMNDIVIRNGCGGTRAAYGTATVLRTTAALLDVMNGIQNNEYGDNTLLDISSVAISKSHTKFPMEACGCCGNRKEK